VVRLDEDRQTVPRDPTADAHAASAGDSRADRTAAMILVGLLLVRVLAAAFLSPAVVADAAGYDAAAYRLLRVGSFAYPIPGDTYWTRSAGDLIITDVGRERLLQAPRNAYTMPGYAVFLAAVYRVFGAGSDRWLVVRVIQALLSVVTALLVYLIGRRFGPRVGLTALILAAVYPPLTLANSYVLTEVVYTFLLVLFAFLFLRWVDTHRWVTASGAGAVFGLGVWVRPTGAPWLLVAGAIVIVATRDRRARAAAQLLVMALIAAMVMAPWWIRNAELLGRFVPFGTPNGLTVAEGMRRDVAEQPPFPWQTGAYEYTSADRAMRRVVSDAFAAAPDPAGGELVYADYWNTASRQLVRTLTARWPLPLLRARLRQIAVSLTWPYAISPSAARGVPFFVSWLMHIVLLVLFVLGLAALPRRLDAWLLVSVPVYTVLAFAIVLPLHRYYFPAVPIALVIAAIGLDRFVLAPLVDRRAGNALPQTLRRPSGAAGPSSATGSAKSPAKRPPDVDP
jgi:4-amino-4-deoxy-L-arabinose transferase-like glycosyltransferase